MAHDELEFVEWLRLRQRRRPSVALGIGDDMAVVAPGADLVAISCDMLLDGVHFDTRRHALGQIGRKAIACGLSDCAAMAVRPVAATVSLALPKSLSPADTRELAEGMCSLAEQYDMPVVGGDTTRWNHPLAIDVAVLAAPHEGIDPVMRSGAVRGDVLCVTGSLGGSLLRRHLSFTPRVAEAKTIAATLTHRLHAMMDISDGLSLDVWRMCQASGVGATLDERQLEAVVSVDARRLAEEGDLTAIEHALTDGEDYELLVAVSGAAEEPGSFETLVPGVRLYPVGTITDGDLLIRSSQGVVEPLEPKGFVH